MRDNEWEAAVGLHDDLVEGLRGRRRLRRRCLRSTGVSGHFPEEWREIPPLSCVRPKNPASNSYKYYLITNIGFERNKKPYSVWICETVFAEMSIQTRAHWCLFRKAYQALSNSV